MSSTWLGAIAGAALVVGVVAFVLVVLHLSCLLTFCT
jgi:hypothetical protein